MATFNRFHSFIEEVFEAKHDFSSHVFKVALTNVAPVATNTVLANITQIANGNGYTTGGVTVTVSASSQTLGAYSAVVDDLLAAWTSSGAGIADFRYAVLFNDSHASDGLVGWWDFGSTQDVPAGVAIDLNFGSTIISVPAS